MKTATGEENSGPPSNRVTDSSPPSSGAVPSSPPSNGAADSSPPSSGSVPSSPPSNGAADSSPPSSGATDSTPKNPNELGDDGKPRFPRFRVLDAMLTACRRDEAASSVVFAAQDHSARRYACVFAVDSLLKCRDNPELAVAANESDWTFCDGMPLVLLGRHVAKLPVSRCYGPDLMLDVCDRGRAVGLRHFFYGGADEETVTLLSRNLRERFPGLKIVGSIVPPFRNLTEDEERDVVRKINEAAPDIAWIGIGTPKQDFWARRMRPKLNAPVLMAVGAAFNFHAGKVPQAPRWMQRACLEWLYRLCAEPRRLWRRYIIGNPRFVLLILRQWLTGTPGGRLCERADA